jgi:hypothetical protein
MQPTKAIAPPRQQKLVFEQDDTWELLPQNAREAVRNQLVLALQTAVLHAREKRSRDDRQDSR